MFRGRTTPLSRFGPQNKRLTGAKFPVASAAYPVGALPAPYAILCSKHPKGKNPHPARAGDSLTTDLLSWTRREPKWSARKMHFRQENCASFPPLFNAILIAFGRFSLADPSAERWQSG